MNLKADATEELIGQMVTKFYRSKEPTSTTFHEDGLGELFCYKLYIECINGMTFLINEQTLQKVDKPLHLVALNPDFQECVIGKTVKHVIRESQHGGLFIVVENDYLFYHEIFFGSELMIDRMKNVFDESGTLK